MRATLAICAVLALAVLTAQGALDPNGSYFQSVYVSDTNFVNNITLTNKLLSTGTLIDGEGTGLANIANTTGFGLVRGTAASPDTGISGVAAPYLNISRVSRMSSGGTFSSSADNFFGSLKLGTSTNGDGDIHNSYTIFAASQNQAGTGITDGTTNETISIMGWSKSSATSVGRIYSLIGSSFPRGATNQAIAEELDMDNGIGAAAQDIVNGITFPGALIGLNLRATTNGTSGSLHSSAAIAVQANSQNESWLQGTAYLANSVADGGYLHAFPALSTNVNILWGPNMAMKAAGQLAIGVTNLSLTSGGRGIHVKSQDGVTSELKLEAVNGGGVGSASIVELYGMTSGGTVVRNRLSVSGNAAVANVGSQTAHDVLFNWNGTEVYRIKTNSIVVASTNALTMGGNLNRTLSAGSTSYIDANLGAQTNQVSGTYTLNYCTNGTDLLHRTSVLWLFNASGSDQTLTLGTDALKWRTNVTHAVPTKITNGWITKLTADIIGPTGTSAQQTNVYVAFEFYH